MIVGEPLGPRVVEALPLDDYKIALTFTTGERRIFDARPLLSLKAFASLSDNEVFDCVSVAYGSLLWPNDIDYCPDTLYAESHPFP